jgi:hypothetical protein
VPFGRAPLPASPEVVPQTKKKRLQSEELPVILTNRSDGAKRDGEVGKNGSRQLCLLFPTIASGVGPTARLPLCPPPPSHSPRPPHTFHRHYRQRGTPTGCGDWRRVWRFRGGVWAWRTDSRFECGAIPMGDATKLDPSRCAQERTPARGRGSGTDGDKQR